MAAEQPGTFAWWATDLVRRVAGMRGAVLLSSDGMRLCGSADLSAERADQLAGVAAMLDSFTQAMALAFSAGQVGQTIVAMDHGYLLASTVPGELAVAALVEPYCSLGDAAYEMALLMERVLADRGPIRLTPPHLIVHRE